ncbi:MAG: twin-arginine translocase TatA/TatE family subunit [Gemmatimonadetes bacterium]|nr:twin-arginine translocase TatA/TatE family subunit [Gemmatimonadota bacterium]
MGGLSGWELIVVFVVVLLIFGPRKIPEVARGIGKALGSMRRLTAELQREINLAELEDPPKRIRPEGSSEAEPDAPVIRSTPPDSTEPRQK